MAGRECSPKRQTRHQPLHRCQAFLDHRELSFSPVRPVILVSVSRPWWSARMARSWRLAKRPPAPGIEQRAEQRNAVVELKTSKQLQRMRSTLRREQRLKLQAYSRLEEVISPSR